MEKKLISLVVPFHNEGLMVDVFFQALQNALAPLQRYGFEIVCIDDGSQDDTLARLLSYKDRHAHVAVLELTRNFGKESAITAGLDYASGDAVILLDADLQDPPDLIGRMLAAWEHGDTDMVLARRQDRSSDALLKRLTARWFYQVHNRLSKVQVPPDVGDFRLIGRPALDALKSLPERRRFMKGLFAWVGFRTVFIDYVRPLRAAGSTKFSGWKLWNLALDGITSFSTVPLRVWTYVGGTCALLTLCYAAFIIVRTLIEGSDIPGYASLLVATLFFGSVQLICIGVLGEYIGRIYEEVKQRPVYLTRAVHRHRSSA